MKKLFFTLIILLNISIANSETVKYVYDGDTFTTNDNKKVRLLNINTPETAKKNSASEPFSIAAKKQLEKLIDHKKVKLVYDKEKKDKYGRLLAYVYLNDGTFINAEMLKSGMAHLYTFPNNISKFEELKKAEDYARNKKIGLWSHPRYKIINANLEQKYPKQLFGKYQTSEGKVLKTININNVTYLNFGSNWKTDFSVEIPQKYLEYFSEKNIDPITYYQDKTLRIRGILKPVNGALITATHPQQLEVIN